MGLFHQYILKNLNESQVEAERKQHLRRIGELLSCDVITYAARLSSMPVPAPTAVVYDDLLPFVDLLDGLKSKQVAVILETHGGSGEIGRQMVEILHERFEHVRFIVPGTAKSTGTIMVLGGHEILMGPGSSLGPIDAQLQQDGKTYSADALIEGLNRIKLEIEDNGGKLSPAYIPFLQKLSPGEIEHAHNALDFARETVREWLIRYKFGKWDRKETSGDPVTAEYKESVAKEIARALSSQSKWKTHGRSLRIPDLRDLGLKITDFSADPALYDAIQRYHVLLRLTLDQRNVYKVIETPEAAVSFRFQATAPAPSTPPALPKDADSINVEAPCPKCQTILNLQLDFKEGIPLRPGSVRFPDSGHTACPKCGNVVNLQPVRTQIEEQLGRKAITPQPTT